MIDITNDNAGRMASLESTASTTDAWYPEQPPTLRLPGTFEAWVAATDNPTGKSGMAWDMTEQGQKLVIAEGTMVSQSEESGEQRGYLGGIAAILEAQQTGSTITIHCLNEYIVRGINEWIDGWAKKGWKGKAHADIWQRILKVRNERELTIRAVHWHKGNNPYIQIFDRLLERARLAVTNATKH